MASNYEIGTRAWQPDAAEGWVASELVSKSVDGGKAKLVFQLENGESKTIEVSVDTLQSGDDPSLPPLMNPTMLEASDDLTNLSHLNEPAGRFSSKAIHKHWL
jgi:myosin-5